MHILLHHIVGPWAILVGLYHVLGCPTLHWHISRFVSHGLDGAIYAWREGGGSASVPALIGPVPAGSGLDKRQVLAKYLPLETRQNLIN